MIRPLRPAGFWRRAAAFGLDALWLFAVAGTVSWLLFGVALPPAAGAVPPLAAVVVPAIHELLPAVVCIAGWSTRGTTPGKLLVELRVVDARTGGRPTVVQAVLRYAGYFVSALPLGLGFVWIALDRRKQGLHDKLARTRVMVVAEEILPGVPA